MARPNPRSAGYPEALRKRAVTLYAGGMTAVAVAALLDVNEVTVRAWVRRRGGTMRTGKRFTARDAAVGNAVRWDERIYTAHLNRCGTYWEEAHARRHEAATAPTLGPMIDGKTWTVERRRRAA